MPLVLYALGTASHMIAKVFSGKGSAYHARFALFWALLAASPAWLIWGLVAGFVGAGVWMQLTGAVALGAFLLFWAMGLRAVEWGQDAL